MRGDSHVPTERAYCVPTAPIGNVQSPKMQEAEQHRYAKGDLDKRDRWYTAGLKPPLFKFGEFIVLFKAS